MNKYLMSIGIAATTMFSAHAHTAAPATFAQLESIIITNAEVTKNKFSDDILLVLLNLFALEAQGSKNALIKCAQFIEKDKDMLEAIESFGLGTMNVMQTYMEAMQRKIDSRNNLTEEQEETLQQKLNTKLQELFAYIHTVYYDVFYRDISTKNPHKLTFMFDENGIIPQEKRTEALPISL